MSNSLPRTMRRNAAMIGSTSRYSGSKVLGLTVPSLSAWLLPCVRVTVISLGPAMAAFRSEWMLRRIISPFCRPRASGLVARIERQRNAGTDQKTAPSFPDVATLHPGYTLLHILFRRDDGRRELLAALETALLVDDQRGLHPGRRQVILDHLRDRLEQLELVTGRPLGPERDRGFQRRAARQAAGHLRDQDGGILRQRKARAGPGPHPIKGSAACGVRLERRPDPERLRHRGSVAAGLPRLQGAPVLACWFFGGRHRRAP